MPIIRVVRHGQTDHNLERRYQGRLNVPLNSVGREQAGAVARMPELCNTGRIICSPLRRVLETAQIISTALNVGMEMDERLVERSLGVYEGLTKEQAASRYPEIYRQNITRIFSAAPPDGETPHDVCRRVNSLLDDISTDQTSSDILVVTHGFVARAIDAYFNPGKNNEDFFKYNLHNAEIATYNAQHIATNP